MNEKQRKPTEAPAGSSENVLDAVHVLVGAANEAEAAVRLRLAADATRAVADKTTPAES